MVSCGGAVVEWCGLPAGRLGVRLELKSSDDKQTSYISVSGVVPDSLGTLVARRLIEVPAFVRHVVLDRWFLHANEPALGPAA